MSYLYIGSSSQMLADALHKASELLGVENLDNHADYLYVDVPDGKKSMGVEEAAAIISATSYAPTYAEKKVVLLNHFELMTVPAQNKLLLLIESGTVEFLCVAYADTLLDTIKSRLQRIEYHPVPYLDFCKEIGEFDELGRLAYSVTYGCPTTFRSMGKFFETLKALYGTRKNPVQMFDVLHLVKEKDPLSVCADRQQMLYVILALEFIINSYLKHNLVTKEEMSSVSSVVDELLKAEVDVLKSYYTKDDFFCLVMNTVVLLEGGSTAL